MHIDDFTYCNVQGLGDRIANYGDLYGYGLYPIMAGCKGKEDTTGPAYVQYSGTFVADLSYILPALIVNIPVTLRIEVGNDSCVYTLT